MASIAERAGRLELIANVEDSLYAARQEFQGPTIRAANGLAPEITNHILAAKAAVDRALDIVERLRKETEQS